MKAGEIIRIIIFTLLGAALIFLVQPYFIYGRRIIGVRDVPLEAWISQNYFPGAWIVFIIALLATVVWCALAASAQEPRGRGVSRWALIWWILLTIPLMASVIVAFLLNESAQARPSLIVLFVLDALVLFWLPTATSTPRGLKFVPLGAFFLRNLLGLK